MFEDLQQELATEGSVRFYVRARPGASKTEAVEKMDDESIKIDIASKAEQGKANAELTKFLSQVFAVPASSVEIVSGKTARVKLVRVVL